MKFLRSATRLPPEARGDDVTAGGGDASQDTGARACCAAYPGRARPRGASFATTGERVLVRDVALLRAAPVTQDQAAARAVVEQLFALHHREIYTYLNRMLREEELAADLTQETFIKAFRALDSLEDPARARAWLYQIASRTALDELRRRKIVRFIPWTGESGGTAASAEEVALHRRLSGEMERALAAIPERQRNAIILAEVHELTGVELAAALGVSHVAARAVLTRARESLRQALAVERAEAATRGVGEAAPAEAEERRR